MPDHQETKNSPLSRTSRSEKNQFATSTPNISRSSRITNTSRAPHTTDTADTAFITPDPRTSRTSHTPRTTNTTHAASRVSSRLRSTAANHRAARREQKAHLKALVDNSRSTPVRNAGRIMKYGAAGFKRNIWLSIAATLVMTVTLIILLVTIGASMILSSTADAMRQKIDITIFFRPGTELGVLENLADIMRSDSNVRSVTVADSLAEYNNLRDENADNEALLATLEDPAMHEMMLGTMQATMRIKVYNPDDLSGVRYLVENDPIFQENLDTEKDPTYDVNQAEIATINSWASVAKNGGLILGAVFLAISILVIFNTIRMAIFSRREEIYMMKLVGASTSFIRGPFLIEAEICGLISGVLAATAVYFFYQLVAEPLAAYGIDISQVSKYLLTNRLVLVYLITIASGMLVGTVSARLAMKKHLK